MRKSNYDKYPSTLIDGSIWAGWDAIIEKLQELINKRHFVLVVECYQGVFLDEIEQNLLRLCPRLIINTEDLFKPKEEIYNMTFPYLTNDRLFGYMSRFTYEDFFSKNNVSAIIDEVLKNNDLVIVYGPGASYICNDFDLLLYADMPRWEIQNRFRRKRIHGLGVDNSNEAPSFHYKRGYFVDWNVCDLQKKNIMKNIDFWLDTHIEGSPKMIDNSTMQAGLYKIAHMPFRVVPFFDPAPWGGQWMKTVCDLDQNETNYGWCFDCVPEENSLNLEINGYLFEFPANNLVFNNTTDLLGEPVESRFGQSFPIRFDFLDTIKGGNLSLQVHPTTQYIHDKFGLTYTQDESYYLLDAEENACVFLGLKTGIDPEKMIDELIFSNKSNKVFDVEKYVNKFSAQKHDHYLIPNGTVHCSGAGSMVLEISSTPNIFTFKLWDWGRLGLDGIPRPINIEHGRNVIKWNRTTEYVKKNLINRFSKISEGDGWVEEKTGLHENEFIETRRHWFDKPVMHNTNGGVNVLNLIDGDEAIVESPKGRFEPFIVHYAETFIVPASVGEYVIRPFGKSAGKRCGTIKAYVRF